MRAVVFDLSVPKYLAATALGRQMPSLYHGRPSCLSIRDVPAPALRGPDWVRLRVERAGVCGSDISTIFFKFSPSLSPFSSNPFVMGHEVYARVESLGDAARGQGLREGDRVVVNPFFGCTVRDEAPCPACAREDLCTCHRAGSSSTASGLSPGVCVGFHKELPGGWSEHMVAHRSQVFRVPDSIPDDRAVMIEPLAIGVHAALKHLPRPDDKVLVIGGGMIAFTTLAALRRLGCESRIAALTLLDYQAEVARRLGAHDVLVPRPGTSILDEVCRLTGARRHKPVLGPDVLTGGFDVIFDCVGSPDSVRDSLRFLASQGTLVLVGGAGETRKLDLTSVWNREQRVLGTVGYAPEPARDRRHTFDLTRELFEGAEGALVDELVTHRFPLERYRDAIVANVDRAGTRSVKTIFVSQPA